MRHVRQKGMLSFNLPFPTLVESHSPKGGEAKIKGEEDKRKEKK